MEVTRSAAVQALALTIQEWKDLGLGNDPTTAASSDVSVTTDRISALLLVRIVAIVAPTHYYADLSTSGICRKALIENQPWWPEKITLEVWDQLRTFVRFILESYEDHPFHNFEHAYHVVISSNKLMDLLLGLDSSNYMDSSPPPTFGLRYDPISLLALIFAALVHDVAHKGVTNRQLIVEDDMLALRYSDQSIHEQRSLTLAFEEFLKDDYIELRAAMFPDPTCYRFFRRAVIGAVLSTDVAGPERTQITKSKWKEAFENPHQISEEAAVPSRRGSMVSEISMPRAVGGRPSRYRRTSTSSINSIVSDVTTESYALMQRQLQLDMHNARYRRNQYTRSTSTRSMNADSVGGESEANSYADYANETYSRHRLRRRASEGSGSSPNSDFAEDSVAVMRTRKRGGPAPANGSANGGAGGGYGSSSSISANISNGNNRGRRRASNEDMLGSSGHRRRASNEDLHNGRHDDNHNGRHYSDDNNRPFPRRFSSDDRYGRRGGHDDRNNSSEDSLTNYVQNRRGSNEDQMYKRRFPIEHSRPPRPGSNEDILASYGHAVPSSDYISREQNRRMSSNGRRNSTNTRNTQDTLESLAAESVGLAQKRMGGYGSSRRGRRLADRSGANYGYGTNGESSEGEPHAWRSPPHNLGDDDSSISLTPESSDGSMDGVPITGVTLSRSARTDKMTRSSSIDMVTPKASYNNASGSSRGGGYSSNDSLDAFPTTGKRRLARRASTGNVPIRFGPLSGEPIQEEWARQPRDIENEQPKPTSKIIVPYDDRHDYRDEYKPSPTMESAKYRRRLGIRRSMDLSGESIELYSRNSLGNVSAMSDRDFAELEMDEPDELRATVVLELILRAADVAHALQGWENMAKYSGRLFMELAAAHRAGRGHDPAPGWFDNQIKVMETYYTPLAQRLDETGVFGEFLGAIFHHYVVNNKDQWLIKGYDLTESLRRRAAAKYPQVETEEDRYFL